MNMTDWIGFIGISSILVAYGLDRLTIIKNDSPALVYFNSITHEVSDQ